MKRFLQNRNNSVALLFLAIASIGFIDAAYLTIIYFSGELPTCTLLEGCEKVAASPYSTIGGIPVALLGTVYYLFVVVGALAYFDSGAKKWLTYISYVVPLGFIFSLWLTFVQIYLIEALCIYCIFSAGTSTALFFVGVYFWIKNHYTIQS